MVTITEGCPGNRRAPAGSHTDSAAPAVFPLVLCRESPDQGAVIKLPVPERGADSRGGAVREGVPVQGARKL